MFSSQSKLFSRNQRSQDIYPTDGAGDFSQLQNANCTQFELFSENSQDNSQLFFSQNDDMSAPNSDNFRQVPVYEKYIAKPSLFGMRGRGRPVPNGRPHKNPSFNVSNQGKVPGQLGQHNNLQQIASQKAKAKERDERDLLGSIVKMVKECADEVKSSLTTFKETDDGRIVDLQSSVQILVSSFEQNSNKILTAVNSREDFLGKIHSLERDLQKKDDEIKSLKDMKSNSTTEESCTLLLDKMRSFMNDQQTHMDQKLQNVLETTQEQLTLVKDMGQNKKHGQDESSKSLQDLKYSNQRQLHDVEKRLIDEIVQIRDDFDRQKRDMENFYRNQMQSYHQKQCRDIELSLKKGIDTALQKSEFITPQDIKDSEAEIMAKYQCRQKQMENQIKTTTKQQSEFLLKQCQQSLKKHQSVIQKSLIDSFDSLKHQQKEFIDKSQSTLREIQDAGKMAWENDNVPKHVQDQLNTLHNNHQSEIKRLEAEIKTQKEKSEPSSEVQRVSTYGGINTSNVYDSSRDTINVKRAGPLFEKSVGFTSPKPLPGTRWNSRRIFGRTNPSPVATVLPQRQPVVGKPLPDVDRSCESVELTQDRPTTRNQAAQNRQPLQSVPKNKNTQQPEGLGENERTNTLEANQRATRKRKQPRNKKSRAKKGRQTRQSRNDGETASVDDSFTIDSEPVFGVMKESQREGNGQPLNRQPVNSQPLNRQPLDRQPLDRQPVNRQPNDRQPMNRQPPLNPTSVYDFCDDVHTDRQNMRYTDTVQHLTQQSGSSSQTLSNGSAESSPSLSVTEVLITRRVHNGKMDNRDMMSVTGPVNQSNTGGDFFSSPNMLEMFNPRQNQSSMANHQRQVQIPRIKERRKLCDFDTQHTQVFQMIQCLQKNKY